MTKRSLHLRLSGGLGNQLFQITASAYVSRFLRRSIILHETSLSTYSSPRQPLYKKVIGQTSWLSQSSKVSHRFLGKAMACLPLGKCLPFLSVNDRNIFKLRKSLPIPPIFVDGYFQYGWTDSVFVAAVASLNVIPTSQSERNLVCSNEAAVHIRGSDFKKLGSYNFLTFEYYLEAVSLAIDFGFRRFVIVSDDPDYASSVLVKIAERFPLASIRLAGSSDEITDFNVLRSAPARIIGNSTFSWWSSVLASTSGPTWAPSRFVRNRSRDYYLPNELTIQV